MTDPDNFDALLKERFDCEHRHVPADPFIAATTQRIRTERRYKAGVRTALRAAALVAAILASPWLIAGATRLNGVLESSFAWITGIPGAWVLGVLVVAALLVSRMRSN